MFAQSGSGLLAGFCGVALFHRGIPLGGLFLVLSLTREGVTVDEEEEKDEYQVG